MLSIRNAAALAAMLTAAVSLATETDLYRWCADVDTALRTSLRIGQMASTYAEEKTILIAGVNEALKVSRPKNEPFLRQTLEKGLEDLVIFQTDPSREVGHLRFVMRGALDDLHFLDQWLRNKDDKRTYVIALLDRAQQEGLRVPQEAQEIAVLSNAATRAVDLLDVSDYRRTENYACARRALAEAVRNASNLPVGDPTRVIILREGIRVGRNYLVYLNTCR